MLKVGIPKKCSFYSCRIIAKSQSQCLHSKWKIVLKMCHENQFDPLIFQTMLGQQNYQGNMRMSTNLCKIIIIIFEKPQPHVIS